MENQGKKYAVLVGCLYLHSGHDLGGCINDVMAMKEVLISRFGFDQANMEVLTDAPESEIKPTGANIMKVLNGMVEKAQNGDILFFHFSGHGTLVRHKEGEAIVPCDFNLITDVDFRKLVNCLPKGVTLTIISDSCHSGGLIAQEKEQIGPYTNREVNIQTLSQSIVKYIPIETILQHLASQTMLSSSDVGTHLLELFGSEASLMFHHDMDVDLPHHHDNGILLSGCQKDEFSGDLSPGQGNHIQKACGAFSNAVQIVLKKYEGPITNKELVKLVREVLNKQRLEQHPCLYCSDANATATFLMQPPKV